ncbi:Homeobox domain [Trinorchestia longiramus]|nr:Homeobox domain [Trinorchestia longiramus]
MSTGYSSLSHTSSTSVNVVVDASLGVMGVRFEAAYPDEASLQLRPNIHASSTTAEGTTIVSCSPEPSSRSPSLRSDSDGHTSPDRHVDGSNTGSPVPRDHLGSPVSRDSLDVTSSPADLMSTKTESGPTTGIYSSSPLPTSVPQMTATTTPPLFHPIFPLPVRPGTLSPSRLQYPPAMPITPTTTPPVPDTSLITTSTIPNILPTYMTHMMNSTFQGVLPHTWHPHVYGPPVKSPTSHSIADILGYRNEKPKVEYLHEPREQRQVSDDEPLNLTVKSSVDYSSAPNKVAGVKRKKDGSEELCEGSNDGCGERKKKKARTTFTGRQIFELERQFEVKKYLSSSERADMAKLLNVTETQVSYFFRVGIH